MKKIDVYSFGIITPSLLLLLESNFPKPDEYSEVKQVFKMTGGEACNSSIVLSRLGISVALDGLWLGKNLKTLEMLDFLKLCNIDTDCITIKEGFQNVEETVISDRNTRAIFANYGILYKGNRYWNLPNKEMIKNSKIVCLDPFLQNESLDISKYCIEISVPYVTIDCHFDSFISQNADFLIISGEYRNANFQNIDKLELFNMYVEKCRGTVIFTSAENDILYNHHGIKKFNPYQVNVIDTAGAGDSFRSGIIYGKLMNFSIEKTIAFASLLASYICQSFPGVMNSPTYDELIDFSIKKNYNFVKIQ